MDELILTDYVLDQLDASERARVEAALATSPALQAQVRALTELLGELGAELPPVVPSAEGRARLLAAVAPRPRLAGLVDALAHFVDVARSQAAALLASVDDPERWGKSPWAGVDVFHIEPGPRLAGAEVGFVRMPAGARFPWHGHDGDEDNLILQGALRVSDGQVVQAGESYPGAAGVTHDFVALDGPDLIFVSVLHCNLLFVDGTQYGRHTPH